jgi:hypothetical protein
LKKIFEEINSFGNTDEHISVGKHIEKNWEACLNDSNGQFTIKSCKYKPSDDEYNLFKPFCHERAKSFVERNNPCKDLPNLVATINLSTENKHINNKEMRSFVELIHTNTGSHAFSDVEVVYKNSNEHKPHTFKSLEKGGIFKEITLEVEHGTDLQEIINMLADFLYDNLT